MPNTLPVPSNAALRTLRNIALGTSCTVAFTTGLLTEDRRRRIHAAREVHNNANKLKSSRKYHSGGSPTTESSEDLVLRYDDDGFWQAKDSLSNIQQAQNALPLEPAISPFADPRPPPSFKSSKYRLLPLPKTSRNQPFDQSKNLGQSESLPAPPPCVAISQSPALSQNPTLRKVFYKPGEAAKASSLYRQKKLASDVTKLLED
jgi:hypothetical protein